MSAGRTTSGCAALVIHGVEHRLDGLFVADDVLGVASLGHQPAPDLGIELHGFVAFEELHDDLHKAFRVVVEGKVT